MGVEDSLSAFEGLTPQMLVALAEDDIKTLEDLCKYFGKETKASVSRELTKIHEETIRGTLKSIKHHYSNKKPKGEIVIVIASNN